MDMRELKALELAARAKIVANDDGTWGVPSQSTGGTYRVVTWPGAESCTCEDFQLRQQPCKHVIAARLVEEREGKKTAPPKEMIARSALPLRVVETGFAVDSSGFSVSKFVRWHDEKYGVERSGHDWVKAHVCTGVKTNVVTAVEIKDRDTNDCPQLPELVRATAQNFTLGDVSADKGYLSADNVNVIAAFGGTPFIAPKSNTTGGVGGLFEKMYHFYCFNREEFLRRYHQRSNVESTFSAVKRKFGDHVRSR